MGFNTFCFLASCASPASEMDIITGCETSIRVSTLGGGRMAGEQKEKISVALSDEVLDWVRGNSGGLDASAFIDKVLREQMRLEAEACDVCEELGRIRRRMDALEKSLTEYRAISGRWRRPRHGLQRSSASWPTSRTSRPRTRGPSWRSSSRSYRRRR